MTSPSHNGAVTDRAAVEADIARTRDDLAHTVDQLAARLDVKSRVRDRAAEAKDDSVRRLHELGDRATDARGRPTPAVLVAGAGLLAAVGVAVAFGVRRRRSAPNRWWR